MGCNVPLAGELLCNCFAPVFECDPSGGKCIPEIGCEGTCSPTWMLYGLIALAIFVCCILPCIMFKYCCNNNGGSGDAKRKVLVVNAAGVSPADRKALLSDM